MLFYEHHISCLPIVKDDVLVGIVTETDLLHTLIGNWSTPNQPGLQIEIKAQIDWRPSWYYNCFS